MNFLGLHLISISGLAVSLSTLIIAGAMFILGKERQHYLWGIFCIAVCIWSGSFYPIGQLMNPDSAMLWWKIAHIGVIFIPIVFFQFSLEFIGRKEKFAVTAFYVLGIILCFLDLYTNLIVANTRLVFNEFYYDAPGGLYLYLTIFFITLILYAHLLVYKKYKSSTDQLFRARTRYFFTATSIGFIGGGLSFLPVYGVDLYPITIILVVIAPALIGFAILRYRLFDIKVVAAQFLTVILIISTLLRVILSSSVEESLLNVTLLCVTLIIGFNLIRGVRHEIEQREKIELQEKELQLINKQQENLLHFMSHEIKGYLTKSEAGFAAITQGDFGAVSPELTSMADAALTDVRRGVRTVMDILDASNLKKGTVTYKKQVFDMKDIVTRMVDELRPAADEKHLTIDMHIAWEIPCKVLGDEEKIRDHVVRNLIDNAIKYTPSGSVTIEVSRKDGTVRFAIADSGVGITPDDMARLFTEGGHGKDSIKVNVHSTGYGLFIAKTIVDAHGGTIHAESDGAGTGSRFTVELPAV